MTTDWQRKSLEADPVTYSQSEINLQLHMQTEISIKVTWNLWNCKFLHEQKQYISQPRVFPFGGFSQSKLDKKFVFNVCGRAFNFQFKGKWDSDLVPAESLHVLINRNNATGDTKQFDVQGNLILHLPKINSGIRADSEV